MGSTSDKAFVFPTFQHLQEQATDPTSECNPPAGIDLQGRPRHCLCCLSLSSLSRRHNGKAFITPTFQHRQQATDLMSEHHPPAVDLRGGSRRCLRHIIVVVIFVEAQRPWPVDNRSTRTRTISTHHQPTCTLPPPPLPLLEQSNGEQQDKFD
jgi:hypothetical protein